MQQFFTFNIAMVTVAVILVAAAICLRDKNLLLLATIPLVFGCTMVSGALITAWLAARRRRNGVPTAREA